MELGFLVLDLISLSILLSRKENFLMERFMLEIKMFYIKQLNLKEKIFVLEYVIYVVILR